MSMFRSQAVAALRKIENDESLDESAVAIIVVGLNQIIREGRTPFQRSRDYYTIGTERFKLLHGLDYYRTILLHRKSAVWYPESDMSELSVLEVYAASQLEPPEDKNCGRTNGAPDYDDEGDTSGDGVYELLDRAHIGSSGSSRQDDIDKKTVVSYRNYVAELSNHHTFAAIEEKQEMEIYLRKRTPGSEFIEQGDLVGVMDAYIKKFYFRGKLRTVRGPSQAIADSVRHATTYARKILRENPRTADIADHLERHCRIGQICEYRGNWKWRF